VTYPPALFYGPRGGVFSTPSMGMPPTNADLRPAGSLAPNGFLAKGVREECGLATPTPSYLQSDRFRDILAFADQTFCGSPVRRSQKFRRSRSALPSCQVMASGKAREPT